MSYIEKNLMNGEVIVYRGKLHWVIFIWPVIWAVVAALAFINGLAGANTSSVDNMFGMLFLLIAAVTGISSWLTYTTSEFAITNKRVVVKVGFIRINSLEVLLNKVEGIQVNQGILGRILGYGSITVSGTGGSKDPFHRIDAPLEFRKHAQEQISSVQDSKL